jgi:hypothetical protein
MNTWTTSRTALALLALCASLTAAAGEEEGIHFQREDWEIACDNTRTCRMAGYHLEEKYDEGRGSVLITRAAGPNTPLDGKVTLVESGGKYGPFDPPAILTLRIDGKPRGKLSFLEKNSLEYSLTPAQIEALLAAARRDHVVEFEGKFADFEGTLDGKPYKEEGRFVSFTLSGNGVSAVLLKMDDFQGRIGTPGALIRKGNQPEESVLPPRPAPVIRAAKVSKALPRTLTESEAAALKPRLLRSKGSEEACEFDDPESRKAIDSHEITLAPLDERYVLISMPCWRDKYAYNEAEAYWVMDRSLAGTPKFVTIQANKYENGVISGSFGWVGGGSSWVWDGRKFRQSSKWHAGIKWNADMSPGLAVVGAWHLPTLVTRVVDENGKDISSKE